MDLFTIKFITISILDIIDIIIVFLIFYKLYEFFKGSRAAQMLIGLALIVLLTIASRVLHLQSLGWIMGKVQTVWVIAFVIVFQPELRRILINIGQNRLFRTIFHEPRSKTINETVEATQELVRRKWGGLIVLSKENSLKNIKENSTELNAKISTGLLISIFNPNSPLHDGAVIIQNDIIEAAGCILPLSSNPDLDPLMGTRHRAALGMAEESDAIIVVISEETQKVALAHSGMFYRNVDEDMLRGLLNKLFFTGLEEKK